MSPPESLPSRVLCLVTDVQAAGGADALELIAVTAVRNGVNMLQVRDHDLSETDLAALARRLKLAVGPSVMVAVNGSIKAAVDSRCDAAHFPERIDDARSMTEAAHAEGLLAGRSVHSVEAAETAVGDGADYLFMGTVYPSRSHPGGPVCGVDGVREVVEAVRPTPVIGIGGVTSDNAGALIAAGAAGVAVIGAIIGASDPGTAAGLLFSTIAGQ